MRGRLIFSTLSLFLAVSLSGTALAQAPGSGCDAKCLVGSLMEQIPDGERIALIPFGPPRTAIPHEDSEFLYKRIVSAMHQAKRNHRHEVVSRDLDRAAWAVWQTERENPDYEELWNQRRVGVTVHCNVMGVEEQGVSLLCRAIPVGKGSKLKGEVAGKTALLASKDPFLPYMYSLTEVALELADGVRELGEITKVFLVDNSDGQRTKLTDHMGDEIRRVVEDRFQELLRRRQAMEGVQGAIGGGAATTSTLRRYELHGGLEWLRRDVSELRVRLLDAGKVEKGAKITLQRKWLPDNLIEAGTGRKRYSATGQAFRSKRLSGADVEWAARNAARARIVAAATGRAAPNLPEMRTARHGLEALRRALDLGVTTEERLQGIWEPSPGTVAVRLDARVVNVGADSRPAFEARLANDEVRAREAMYIHLSAKETVHVGVFAWGADHNVFLVFPRENTDVVVPAGSSMVLPRREDKIVIASQPLHGRASDDEAIIVIGSTEKLLFRKLAPLLGGPTGGSVAPAMMKGAEFLGRLGRLDLSRTGISVLPYTVTR